MYNDTNWGAKAKGILKAELKKRDISYQQLAERLAKIGVSESAENIANKISRGKFSAVFLIQCMAAINCKIIQLD